MSTRRVFLGHAGASLAAAVAAALGTRGALAAVAQPHSVPEALAAPVAPLGAPEDNTAGWHVDDMWGPRYAEPVPYVHVATAPDFASQASPADHIFVQ